MQLSGQSMCIKGACAAGLGTRIGAVARRAVSHWLADGATYRPNARLLGVGSETQRLRERVGSLESSRTGLVDAVDTERRRIERDLHDG